MAAANDPENQATTFPHKSETYDSEDSELVDFDGPDDPKNAMNWPTSKKAVAVTLISFLVMLSHIGSTISSPAASYILETFKSTNRSLGTLATTIYLLGYASGPIVIAPMSEMYGRALLYKICIVFSVVFNIGCAVADSLATLVVLRLLAGIVASAPITLGPGSIADMIPRERRAGPMSVYTFIGTLGPMIGPVCGGYITPAVGWRWVFWVMAIASAVFAVLLITFMRESYPYVLLERKTKRLRKETGNDNLRSVLDTRKTPRELFALSITRPVRMLLSPIVFLISLYVAVVYGYMYLCFATFPRVFRDQYGFNTGAGGLAVLGIGIGGLAGVVFYGFVADRLSAYLSRKNDGQMLPEYLLPTLAVGGVCVPIGLFWYGWTADIQTHWIVPIIGSGFVGTGLSITYMASTMYLVDAFTVYAASVTAASTILRASSGALLPLAGNDMFDALGIGWGNSVLGFISVAFLPVPVVFYWYGRRIRESKRFQIGASGR